MDKSTNERPSSQPGGNPPGWPWAFAYAFILLLDLGFIALAQANEYDLRFALGAAVIFTVLAAMGIRHIHTGESIAFPTIRPAFGRGASFMGKFILGGLQAAMGAQHQPNDQGTTNDDTGPYGAAHAQDNARPVPEMPIVEAKPLQGKTSKAGKKGAKK